MAQRYYTLPIKSAEFPMRADLQARTVIGGANPDKSGDEGVPKLFFCQNVVPTKEGLDSVGYTSVIPSIFPAITILTDVRSIRGLKKKRIYMAWDTEGRAYDLEDGDSFWSTLGDTIPSTISPNFSIDDVTLGTVHGVTYIWYRGIGCFVYDESIHSLVSITLTGIEIKNVLGITSYSGYLIVYTEQDIAWSSLIDPTDFTPDQVTGAGGGSVAGIGGAIKFILPNSLGILIYADSNVIAGTYTGNAQYPFKLREVNSSKGGVSLDLVAYEANSASQFSFSGAGLQTVTSQKADIILPEVTDFLAGKVFEDFNEVTKEFITTELTGTMKKKIKYIASRYLVISYGITEFTHVIIYDIGLDRLGKLKITHADCFEYLGVGQVEVSKESLAFLLSSGEVKVVNFSTTASDSYGVVLLGKIQYIRNRLITLQMVDVENIRSDSEFSVTDLVALDGKTTNNIDGIEVSSVDGLRKYAFKNTGINHSLLFIGKFNLNTVFITYNLNGRR